MTSAVILLICTSLCVFRCFESTGDEFTLEEKTLIFLTGLAPWQRPSSFRLAAVTFRDKDGKPQIRHNYVREVVPAVCEKISRGEYGQNHRSMHHPNMEHLLQIGRVNFGTVKLSCDWFESITIAFLAALAAKGPSVQRSARKMPTDKQPARYKDWTVTYLQVKWMVTIVCDKAHGDRYGESDEITLVKQSCQFLYYKVGEYLIGAAASIAESTPISGHDAFMVNSGTFEIITAEDARPYIRGVCAKIAACSDDALFGSVPLTKPQMMEACRQVIEKMGLQ